jgi:hypothetical protein
MVVKEFFYFKASKCKNMKKSLYTSLTDFIFRGI